MPTQEHETTWRILAEHTKLLRWLIKIDARDTITRTDPNMPEAYDPISDAALLVHNTDEEVVHGVVVEVQVSSLKKKARAWALYASALSYRHDCPSTVIIIALTARMERAVHRRIAKLKQEGTSFRHRVLGPLSGIPSTLDPATAADNPLTTLIAVAAFSRRRDGSDSLPFSLALLYLAENDPELRDICHRMLDSLFNKAQAKRLEDHLMAQHATKLGGFDAYLMEKNHAQLQKTRLRALDEGREEGVEIGLEKGREEGREEGRRESITENVMSVLRARGLTVTDAEQQRLERATDAELQGYLCRAATAVQTQAIFEEDQTA